MNARLKYPAGAICEFKMRPFKDVVAQFIGRLCLINQATTFVASPTTKIFGVKHHLDG